MRAQNGKWFRQLRGDHGRVKFLIKNKVLQNLVMPEKIFPQVSLVTVALELHQGSLLWLRLTGFFFMQFHNFCHPEI